jgi:hypothetical protein
MTQEASANFTLLPITDSIFEHAPWDDPDEFMPVATKSNSYIYGNDAEGQLSIN